MSSPIIFFLITLFAQTDCPPNASCSDPGKWVVQETKSPMDDSKTVVLALDAENEIKGWLSTYTPSLIIRCQENTTDLYINVGMSSKSDYGSYGRFTVRIRLDNDKPFKATWGESTDNKALFSLNPIPLARKMVKAKVMLFEFIPFNANPQTVEFNLTGIEQHLPKVAETCEWKI